MTLRKRSLRKKVNLPKHQVSPKSIASKIGHLEIDHFEKGYFAKALLRIIGDFELVNFLKMGPSETAHFESKSLRKRGQFEIEHTKIGHFEKINFLFDSRFKMIDFRVFEKTAF